MNDINQLFQSIAQAKSMGKNPQVIIQNIMQRNPYYQQAMVRLQNMAQGQNPQQFLTQLAKQNGLNDDGLQALKQIFGK